MQPLNFEEALNKIAEADPRYKRDAYVFLREALDYTQRVVGRAKPDEKHVSGKELLDGIRQYALKEFGPMAGIVLDEWGVHACEDFGELVFNMIEYNLLAKRENDTREDFKGGYDFTDAFSKPFIPSKKSTVDQKSFQF